MTARTGVTVIGRELEGSPAARKRSACSGWFIVSLGLPILLSILYFGGLAANRYQAEANFVVRNSKTLSLGAIAGMSQTASVSQVTEDAKVVREYMMSRDVVNDIKTVTNLRDALGLPTLDLIWRFPPLFFSSSDEHLYRHLRRLVSIEIDSTNGISTLKVQAFRAEDARQIAKEMLAHSERLLNRLNQRGLRDALATARLNVEATRAAALQAHKALNDFRLRNIVVDPTRIFQIAHETLLELAKASALAAAQLDDLYSISPGAPQIASLKSRIAALDAQAFMERKRLTAENSRIISDYERLVLEREFAESSYVSAIAAMRAAQFDTSRQHLFLEVINGPAVSDLPAYPHRLWGISAVCFISLCIYGIGMYLDGNLRMHWES